MGKINFSGDDLRPVRREYHKLLRQHNIRKYRRTYYAWMAGLMVAGIVSYVGIAVNHHASLLVCLSIAVGVLLSVYLGMRYIAICHWHQPSGLRRFQELVSQNPDLPRGECRRLKTKYFRAGILLLQAERGECDPHENDAAVAELWSEALGIVKCHQLWLEVSH